MGCFVFFIATVAMVGGGIYYIIERKTVKGLTVFQVQIADLNKEISDLKNVLLEGQVINAPETAESKTDSISVETENWKIYTNNAYGISFKYPTEWVFDKNPVEIDPGSALAISYSEQVGYSVVDKNYPLVEAVFKLSVFSSIQSLPKIDGSGESSNATSLENYFASEKMTSVAVKVGKYNGFDVGHPDHGGSVYYYLESAGKVYVFCIDSIIEETADKIFSTLQLN